MFVPCEEVVSIVQSMQKIFLVQSIYLLLLKVNFCLNYYYFHGFLGFQCDSCSCGLLLFFTGFLKFGINKEEGCIVYREWAPAAQ